MVAAVSVGQRKPETEQPTAPFWLLGLLVIFSFLLRAWAGSEGLNSAHNWDERFTLNNVAAFLRDGRWEPANAYYPSLSYLPQLVLLAMQQGLHRLTGAESLAVFGPHGFSPSAYLVCRLWMALCGALSVAMAFRVGRRVAQALGEARAIWVGLVAALLVAALPVHVDLSAQIKPDIVVCLLALVAFDLGMTAVLTGGTRAYLWAGVGIGMTVAAKYTGVGAALPLLLGQLAGSWKERRRWKGLVVAGLASLVTFVLLNPFLLSIFEYLPKLAEIYERKGEQAGGSHLAVLVAELTFLLRHHGPVIGTVAVLALIWLGWRLFRGAEPGERRVLAMLLGWPLGYSLLYGLGTTLFKGQNYLPVAAFTSVAAALALVGIGGRLLHLSPGRATHMAVGSLAAVGAVAVLWPSVSLTYNARVPSTYQRAAELLLRELQPVQHHVVAFERRDEPLRISAGGFRPGAWVTEDLTALGAERLSLTDAEVFLASRLESPAGDFLRQRLETPRASKNRLAPRLGHAHGPELVVVLHVWEQVGEGEILALTSKLSGRYAAPLAPAASAQTISLSLMLAYVDAARVRVAGHLLPLLLTQRRGGKGQFLTPRFALSPETRELLVELPDHPQAPSEIKATLLRWQPKWMPEIE